MSGEVREMIIVLADEIREELLQAMRKHGRQRSVHESYAVILEELEEFWDIVRLKCEDRSPAKMRRELIQVAAMCMRAILDNNLE
jgi:hypothetical protein